MTATINLIRYFSAMALIEQIRQQQLAAALESRLDSQSFSAMQAAMLMNKLKAAETSKILAAAASAASGTTSQSHSEKKRASNNTTKSKNLAMGDKLNKNTVASLLAKSRELAAAASTGSPAGAKLTPEELEKAERSWSQPELTIEPIFRNLKPDSR